MTYLEEMFTRVIFDEEDRLYHNELFKKVKSICQDIEKRCPHNEAMTLAFNAFHLGVMHIGSCMAKANKYKEISNG